MRIRACLLATVVVAMLGLGAAGAGADTPGKVTIVGPSDVTDSGLFSNVIEPQFENAFPQYELAYTGSAQGTAASNAENGTGGPSVLLLHEAKLSSPSPGKATMSLLVERLGPLKAHKKDRRTHARAAASKTKTKKPTFKKATSTAVATGVNKVTIKHKLPRGFRYAVELTYAGPGEKPVTSGAKDVAVP